MANPGRSGQFPSAPSLDGGRQRRPQPLPTAGDMDTLQRVQIRECRRTSDLGCLEAIVSEAGALAQNLEERVRLTLNGLTELLDALEQYPGRKTVVLLIPAWRSAIGRADGSTSARRRPCLASRPRARTRRSTRCTSTTA